MNKTTGELDVGELFDESSEYKHIIWKVPNAFSLPDVVDYKMQSPEFPFAGATWRLAIFPYGQTKFGSEGGIDLNIIRINSRFPEHSIYFKFCFKTESFNGEDYHSFSSTLPFNSKLIARGVLTFMRKSTFMNKKNIIAPSRVLTITCEMRTKKIAVIDRYSQIEPTEFLLESLEKKSKEEPVPAVSNSKGNKTLRDFKELYLNHEDCDVIMKVKGLEFSAHRNILKARSPVFASTFRNDMKEKATGIIDIEDCDPSTFSDFLCFLYCGNVENLSTENVFSLFIAADKYDVQDLRMECIEFMEKNLSVDTFCDTIIFALQSSEKELIQKATEFYKKNLQEIIVTVKWQSFLIEYPIQSNELLIKALVNKK